MNNRIDEVDNYNQFNNENDETFNNQINMALQMSLRDVNNQEKYLNNIFDQYVIEMKILKI